MLRLRRRSGAHHTRRRRAPGAFVGCHLSIDPGVHDGVVVRLDVLLGELTQQALLLARLDRIDRA